MINSFLGTKVNTKNEYLFISRSWPKENFLKDTSLNAHNRASATYPNRDGAPTRSDYTSNE